MPAFGAGDCFGMIGNAQHEAAAIRRDERASAPPVCYPFSLLVGKGTVEPF